jgi:hypothetical protein
VGLFNAKRAKDAKRAKISPDLPGKPRSRVSMRDDHDCAFGALSSEVSRLIPHGLTSCTAPKAQ